MVPETWLRLGICREKPLGKHRNFMEFYGILWICLRILWNLMELFVSEILGEVEFSGIVQGLIGLPPNIMTCLSIFWVGFP